MKTPWWKGVRLPMGSIPSNWPLLLGAGLSVVVLVGLLAVIPPSESPGIQP